VRQNADYALYHAKETGFGGFVRYWPGIDTRIIHRIAAIRDVDAALREARIEAHYQPIIRFDTRRIVAMEALCKLRMGNGAFLRRRRFARRQATFTSPAN
jgi:predicted signal transduction protein with EAL and GGDEF domain